MMTIPNQSPTPKGADRAQDHLHNLGTEASAMASDLKQQGSEQYEHYRDMAADQLEGLVQGAQSAASAMQGHDSLGLAHSIADLADSLGGFADRMRHKSAEELLQEGARLARQNPLLFMAGTVAVGFALSRFLRASAPGESDAQTGADDGLAPLAPTPREAYGASGPFETSAPDRSAIPPSQADREFDIAPLPAGDPLGESATYPTLDTPVDPLNKGGRP